MKNWLDKYFGFTKREYNGLLVLMAILLLISVFPYFYARYFIQPPVATAAERKALHQLVLVNLQETSYTSAGNEMEDSEVLARTALFKFDPNKITLAQWEQLGLSTKQAQAILNYRNKGGKFYRPSDLQKMYTITTAKYNQLAPYIIIEDASLSNKAFAHKFPIHKSYEKTEAVLVEINAADTLQLDKIKGIGAAFARRIVKYRARLGGFYKKEQLMEVFGLDSMKYHEIQDQFRVDESQIVKIEINTAQFETLKNHPYLTYKQINAILQYRKQHGPYHDVDDLKKVAILTPQIIQHLAPYLSFK